MDTVARAAAYVNIGTNSLNLVDTFLWPLIALRHASALLCFIRKSRMYQGERMKPGDK
jgi:hypothetical protein